MPGQAEPELHGPQIRLRQPRNGEAKPYQVAQFLDMVEEYGLRLESER